MASSGGLKGTKVLHNSRKAKEYGSQRVCENFTCEVVLSKYNSNALFVSITLLKHTEE